MKRVLGFLVCASAAVAALLVLSPPTHGQGTSGPNGDITAVRTGSASGLEGGSERGVANLSVRTDCASGSGVVWDGDSWECGALGAGDIEGVTAGSGLTGGGTSGSVTLDVGAGSGIAVDGSNVVLAMTAKTCAGTDKISAVTATGVFTCTTDADSGGDVTAIATTAPLGVGGTPGATCTSGSCALTERAYGGSTTTGYVPTGGSSSTFLRGDATWVTPTDTNTLGPDGDKGDATIGGTGTTITIDNSAITSAKLNITTTSCSAGQHVSAISAGGVGTCTADAGGITGTLTSGTIPIATGTSTLGDSALSYSGGTWTMSGTLNASGSLTGGTGVFTNSFATGMDASGLAFALATNATATGCINCEGYNQGTTQFRRLLIKDGKGAQIAMFDPDTDDDGTGAKLITLNIHTQVGDADTDFLNSRATLAFSGTNVSINSCGSGSSVTGEAQSFQVVIGSTTSCVIDLNRTFASAPYCTFSPANSKAAADIRSGSFDPRISSSTTQVTITYGSNAETTPTFNVFCPDRR